ncbi:hypothetical protein [Paludisphaera mucosa]|uniref:Uncharacterized protein n=1 Tax=Paludisphaera mucosa TaxID=3030827 RepID=A0ABT6FLT3_9BACT|nr:hypothetical protein [Paludisphaera mucosa]MDG3008338.1 hypothetical protein [Paludisphaera mucosa]
MSVDARIIKVDRDTWRIAVANHGPGVARSIAVSIDGKPAQGHACWAPGRPGFSSLEEGASDSRDLILAFEVERPRAIAVSWIDGGGRRCDQLVVVPR